VRDHFYSGETPELAQQFFSISHSAGFKHYLIIGRGLNKVLQRQLKIVVNQTAGVTINQTDGVGSGRADQRLADVDITEIVNQSNPSAMTRIGRN
jgi:hypothetical protein